MPCPTPMHIVARPYCTSSLRFISCTSVVRIRAPEQPSGCSKEVAPPFGFKRSSSGFIPHSYMTARLCAANASFSSTRPTSSSEIPARSSAFCCVVGTAPIPINLRFAVSSVSHNVQALLLTINAGRGTTGDEDSLPASCPHRVVTRDTAQGGLGPFLHADLH